MGYLVNQVGRVIAVDNPQKFQQWLTKPGFREATKEEELIAIKNRISNLEEMKLKGELEKRKEEVEKTQTVKQGVYLVTVSPSNTDGYGVASSNLIKHLRDIGVDIRPYDDGQNIALVFHNPYSLMRINSPYRIIYTMFESTKIPDDWGEYLQRANLVLVPSKWCQQVFADAGVKSRVLPLGYDDSIFTYVPRENKRKKRNNFTFLHYNAFNIRKGFPEVFKAFTKEFAPDEPVRMTFKTTLDRIPLPINKTQYPNIDIITGKMSHPDMMRIMKKSDCFVFPSRGEGFGLPPLEAMATGMPAIVPNAHGITEYFNADFMYEVKVERECPALYSRYKGIDVGKMYVSDVDHLAAQMRYVYEHQDEALEKGRLASKYVKQWTFSKTAMALKNIFDEVLSKPLPKRQITDELLLEKIT